MAQGIWGACNGVELLVDQLVDAQLGWHNQNDAELPPLPGSQHALSKTVMGTYSVSSLLVSHVIEFWT